MVWFTLLRFGNFAGKVLITFDNVSIEINSIERHWNECRFSNNKNQHSEGFLNNFVCFLMQICKNSRFLFYFLLLCLVIAFAWSMSSCFTVTLISSILSLFHLNHSHLNKYLFANFCFLCFMKKWTEKLTNFLSKWTIILVEWRENHRRSNNKNRESKEKEFQTNEYLYAPPFTHRPLLQNFHTSIIILYA